MTDTDTTDTTDTTTTGASVCDRCGQLVTDVDAGFSPGRAALGHDCGGTWTVYRGAWDDVWLVTHSSVLGTFGCAVHWRAWRALKAEEK